MFLTHLPINAISGVLLGPFYAVLIATLIAVIRFSYGIGSIYAFPGGIPGAFIVGIFAYIIAYKKGEHSGYSRLKPESVSDLDGALVYYKKYDGKIYL